VTNNISINAVILAGGLGSRLRSVVDGQPKVLAEVSGQPFLKYLLDQVVKWHIDKIVLCTGYLGAQIESCFGEEYHGVPLTYSKETMPLGTGGALRFALPLVKSETVLVLNGDSYCAADFAAFFLWHKSKHSSASLLLANMADTKRFGRVQVSETGEIQRFDEKDERLAGPGLINSGIYLIQRLLLESIPEKVPCSLERDMFPTWIGRKFYGYRTDYPFLDIGTPESYAKAETFLGNVNGTN
jgi:NDP-sugar pyrophosphorylase family protein